MIGEDGCGFRGGNMGLTADYKEKTTAGTRHAGLELIFLSKMVLHEQQQHTLTTITN